MEFLKMTMRRILMKKKTLLWITVAVIIAALAFSGCPSPTTPQNSTPTLKGITVTPGKRTIGEGQSATLRASPIPEKAKLGEITWSSEDEDYVTVNASTGRITGVALTDTPVKVYAASKSGIQGYCEVTVIDKIDLTMAFIPGPSFSGEEPTLPEKNNDNIYAFPTVFENGNFQGTVSGTGLIDTLLIYPDKVLTGKFKFRARIQITGVSSVSPTSSSKGLIIGAFKGATEPGDFATGSGGTTATAINLRLNNAVRNLQSRTNDRLAAVGINTTIHDKMEEFIYEVVRDESGITTTIYISKTGEPLPGFSGSVPYTNSSWANDVSADIQADTPVYAGIALCAVSAKISQIELWEEDFTDDSVFYSGDSTPAPVPVTSISVREKNGKGKIIGGNGTADTPAELLVRSTEAAGGLELVAEVRPAYADIVTAQFYKSQKEYHPNDDNMTVNENTGVIAGITLGKTTIEAISNDPIEANYFLTITVTADYVPVADFEISGGYDTLNVDTRMGLSTDISPEVTNPVVVWTVSPASKVKFINSGGEQVDTVTGPNVTVIGVSIGGVTITATATTNNGTNNTVKAATKSVTVIQPLTGPLLNWQAKTGETLTFTAPVNMNPDGSVATEKSASTITWIARDAGTNFTFNPDGSFSMTGRRFNIGTTHNDNGLNGGTNQATTATANVPDGEFDFSTEITKVTVTYSSATHNTEGTKPGLLLYVNNNTASGGTSPLGTDSRLNSKSYRPKQGSEEADVPVNEKLETGGGTIYWLIDPADFASNAGKDTLANAFIQLRNESNNTITITGITVERVEKEEGEED
jgi:hypothetical protein